MNKKRLRGPHLKYYLLSVERIKKQNKIRDKFKKERRGNCTVSQKKLYEVLKQKGFKPCLEREIYTKDGVRFSDIFIKKYGLNIEIDGGYHLSGEQKVKDKLREKEIWERKRIVTIRFTNDEIFRDIDAVVSKIVSLMDELKSLPGWKSSTRKKKPLATLERKKVYRKYNP